MANNYVFKGNADMSGHDNAIKKSATEVYKYEKRVKDAKNQLTDFNKSVNGSVGNIKNLMSSLQSGNLLSFSNGLQGLVANAGSATLSMSSLSSAIGMVATPTGIAVASIGATIAVISKAISSVEEFNNHLRELKNTAGNMSGDTLKQLGEYAIDMSNGATQSAEVTIDAFTKIVDKMPELAQSADAMNVVMTSAETLDDAISGMSTDESIELITNAMNTMGLQVDETNGFINALSEVADRTSTSVPKLSQAFQQSSVASDRANLSWKDTVAVLGLISSSFADPTQAGSSFSQMLTKLEKQTNDQFKPSVVGLEQALKNIQSANLDSASTMELFGKSGQIAGVALLGQINNLNDLKTAMSDSTSATDKAITNNDDLSAKTEMLKNATSNLFTTIGQTDAVQALIGMFEEIVDWCKDIIIDFQDLVNEFNELQSVKIMIEQVGTAFEVTWTISKNVISAMIQLIKDVIQIFVNLQNTVKKVWDKVINSLSQTDVFKSIQKWCSMLYDWFNTLLQKALSVINKIRSAIGLEELGNDKHETKPTGFKTEKKTAGSVDGENDLKSGSGSGSHSSTKTGSQKEVAVAGSLAETEQKIAELQKKLKSGISSNNKEVIDDLNRQIEELTEKANQQKVELGLTIPKTETETLLSAFDKLGKECQDIMKQYNAGIIDKETAKQAIDAINEELKSLNLKEVDIDSLFPSESDVRKKTYDSIVSNINDVISKMESGIIGKDEGKKLIDGYNEQISSMKLKTVDVSNVFPTKQQTMVQLYDKANSAIQEVIKQIEVGAVSKEKGKEIIDGINAGLQSEGLKPVDVSDVFPSNFDSFTKGMSAFDSSIKSIDNVRSSFENLSSTIEEGGNAWEVFMGILSSVMSVIEMVSAVTETLNTLGLISSTVKQQETASTIANTTATTANTVAKTTEATVDSTTTATEIANNTAKMASDTGSAITGATASGASMPFPLNLVAIAAGVAAVIGAIAMVGSFADGGIVKGSTNIGDMNIARVNNGEMILSQSEQGKLFNIIKSGGGGFSNTGSMTSTVKVKGSDLYIALKNYGKTSPNNKKL